MKLSELKTGEKAVIVKVMGHGSFRKRITEMGFVRGSVVSVILNAPLKDPIEYEIIGYKLSLRREEAQMIEVVSESEAEALRNDENLQALEDDVTVDGGQKSMSHFADQKRKVLKVALVGNPNSGKTSLFNVASGSYEHVGNYSGVTVDAKEGHLEYKGYKICLIDLPGTYSISTYSPEEIYVRKYLIEENPDVVINVTDASNLQRNLYLTTQLIDMNLRVVMALNIYDELKQKGDKLDYKQLGHLLGMPIVPTVSRASKGIEDLFQAVIDVYENADPNIARHIHINHGSEVETSIDRLKVLIQENDNIRHKYSTRYLSIKYLEGDKEIESIVEALPNRDAIISARFDEQKRIRELLDASMESAIVDAKYAFIQGALAETLEINTEKRKRTTITDKIDAIVTNKWLAFPIFISILYLVFAGTFVLGDYPMQWIEWLVAKFADFIASLLPAGMLRDLFVDGIVGGVGSVLVFLPNILLLYLFLSLMEDSGYMARVAFIMDKLMHKIGLHGKSFIPMIMGFGCNVPAIMATRTIENPKSRLITMLIIPLMSCAGRMPVFILLAGAFFKSNAALVMLLLYVLGILIAIVVAKIVSFFYKGDDLPFVMELPPYRIPTSKSIFRHTWEKGKQYLNKMAGIILLCSIAIWFLGYFPRVEEGQTMVQQQENSYIGRIGKSIEPVLEPLGFDWRMGVGIIAGVGAKELVVSTLGVMYADGDTETSLQNTLVENVEPAAALAYMVFILLYFPCVATFIAIKQESGGWEWAIVCAVYTIILAWLVSFATYHIFSLLL